MKGNRNYEASDSDEAPEAFTFTEGQNLSKATKHKEIQQIKVAKQQKKLKLKSKHSEDVKSKKRKHTKEAENELRPNIPTVEEEEEVVQKTETLMVKTISDAAPKGLYAEAQAFMKKRMFSKNRRISANGLLKLKKKKKIGDVNRKVVF